MAEAWLLAGLGNPGDAYAETRHNIGAMVVQRLSERMGVRLRKVRFLPVLAAETHHHSVRLYLVTALTFMNVSGPSLASYARKRGIGVERIIACHDEIDLPFGAMRIKKGGGTAGHRGLDSMVAGFGSRDFFRIRMGVGRPPGRQDPADFVLQRFSKAEREEVSMMVDWAADAALSLIDDGLAVTQDRYNRGGVRES